MTFPDNKFKTKTDRYAKTRGGNSKFLYITCSNCGQPLIIYQKDGPGKLLRCYVDRIVWLASPINEQTNSLACSSCSRIVASHMIYKPENRPAYRIIPGSIHLHKNSTIIES